MYLPNAIAYNSKTTQSAPDAPPTLKDVTADSITVETAAQMVSADTMKLDEAAILALKDDTDPKGSDHVQMRLYRITREQLADIQKQEGSSPHWYGNQVLLGLHRDGAPIFTLTCKGTNEKNPPL